MHAHGVFRPEDMFAGYIAAIAESCIEEISEILAKKSTGPMLFADTGSTAPASTSPLVELQADLQSLLAYANSLILSLIHI